MNGRRTKQLKRTYRELINSKLLDRDIVGFRQFKKGFFQEASRGPVDLEEFCFQLTRCEGEKIKKRLAGDLNVKTTSEVKNAV